MRHLILLGRTLSVATLALAAATQASAAPTSILFVGNSFTFGRVDPVMHYNAANVHDLTAAMNVVNSSGSNPYETHNWGGVPGLFKSFTDQAGLNYDVSISARNAASLRGQYLNTNPAGWDLQGNITSQKWDNVVLQGLSDEALPTGKTANANPATFNFYANKIESYIHQGLNPGLDVAGSINTTEAALWGGLAACQAAGLSAGSCNTARNIKTNPNENAAANVYLYETWARPDLVFAHTTPTVDPVTGAITYPAGNPAAVLAYPNAMQSMTNDLHTSYFGLAASNTNFKGVVGVGDAFQTAINNGWATPNPYAANALTDGLLDLWWDDGLHANKYGSYLSGLMMFGKITGLNPQSLGYDEKAAKDLGIGQFDAYRLQQIAAQQLGFQVVPEPTSLALVGLGLLAAAASRRRRR